MMMKMTMTWGDDDDDLDDDDDDIDDDDLGDDLDDDVIDDEYVDDDGDDLDDGVDLDDDDIEDDGNDLDDADIDYDGDDLDDDGLDDAALDDDDDEVDVDVDVDVDVGMIVLSKSMALHDVHHLVCGMPPEAQRHSCPKRRCVCTAFCQSCSFSCDLAVRILCQAFAGQALTLMSIFCHSLHDLQPRSISSEGQRLGRLPLECGHEEGHVDCVAASQSLQHRRVGPEQRGSWLLY